MKTVNVCKTNGCLGGSNLCKKISDTTCECKANGNYQCQRKVKIDIDGKIPITFHQLEKH